MNALVIDGRTRKLCAFVASVTQAQGDNHYQLVLRHALDVGHLPELLAPTEQDEYLGGGETKRRKHFRADMPVILMGMYSAQSSAGHVAVYCNDPSSLIRDEEQHGHRKVLVVGGLGPAFGKKGLKVLGYPIAATLIRGPVEIEELTGSGNSNSASADAALAGVKLLASTDRKAVFLVEGQSDYTYVVRLHSCTEEGMTEFPAEHRADMFSRENIFRRMLFYSAYRGLVRSRFAVNLTCEVNGEQVSIPGEVELGLREDESQRLKKRTGELRREEELERQKKEEQKKEFLATQLPQLLEQLMQDSGKRRLLNRYAASDRAAEQIEEMFAEANAPFDPTDHPWRLKALITRIENERRESKEAKRAAWLAAHPEQKG